MIKVKIRKRADKFYPYSISIMGQEQVLLKEKELMNLYEQITDIIVNDEKLLKQKK